MFVTVLLQLTYFCQMEKESVPDPTHTERSSASAADGEEEAPSGGKGKVVEQDSMDDLIPRVDIMGLLLSQWPC